nr:MAG TPA: RUBREDOXIN TRANSPORT, RUBREDOXIN, GUILLARDIA THETA [Caudoviricetes sp.]
MRDINTRDRETEGHNKVLECRVCGLKFAPIAHWRYSVEENKITGVFAGISRTERPPLHDAFDCPRCGCQIIVNSRMRRAILEDKKQ